MLGNQLQGKSVLAGGLSCFSLALCGACSEVRPAVRFEAQTLESRASVIACLEETGRFGKLKRPNGVRVRSPAGSLDKGQTRVSDDGVIVTIYPFNERRPNVIIRAVDELSLEEKNQISTCLRSELS